MSVFILPLIILGALLILASRRRLKAMGIPSGRLIYLDLSRLKPYPRTLYDPASRLAGRPDYIIQQGRHRIPVEVKSSPSPKEPHRSHVLQLAAYCHLVETTMGRRPPYGILKYADGALKLPYTRAVRQDFSTTLGALRNAQDLPPDRSHNSPSRCRACGFRSSCDQSLV